MRRGASPQRSAAGSRGRASRRGVSWRGGVAVAALLALAALFAFPLPGFAGGASTTANVDTPSDGVTYGADWPGASSLSGTVDATADTLQSLSFTLERTNDSMYFDGNDFASSTPVDVDLAFTGEGPYDWSYTLPAADLESGDSYTLVVTPVGVSGGTGASATATFTYDTSAPAVAVAYPADSATYGRDWTGTISGTASPNAAAATIAGSGVGAAIQEVTGNDAGRYWDGSGFNDDSADYSHLVATYSSGNWSVPFDRANLTSGDTYAVTAQATDSAGNAATSSPAGFAYTVSPPDQANSTVTSSPATEPADGTSAATVTVTLEDSGGAPIEGDLVSLDPAANSSIGPPSNGGYSNASGQVTFAVTDVDPETDTYTASDLTTDTTLTDTAQVVFEKTTPTLALSGSPVTGDNVVTATLTVPDGAPSPTGSVTISDDAGTPNQCSTSTWSGSGATYTASCTVAGGRAGATLSAVFAGDASYDSASSSTLTVGKATPTLALSGSPVTGDNSYTVTVTIPTGGAAPTEGVTVTDSGAGSCDVSLSASDSLTYTGSCEIDSETGGETVTAAYPSSDANYTAATSNTLTVGKATPGLTIAGSSPIAGDNAYTATMTVAADSPAPTGTLTISDSAANQCTTSTWSGSGTSYTAGCTVDFEPGGSTVSASVAADTNYTAATSSNQLTVGKATATLVLSLQGGGTPSAGNNTYVATLTVPTGGPAPTTSLAEWVSFSDGVDSQSSPLTGSGTTYTASVEFSNEAGGRTVSASFPGNASYFAVSSNTLTTQKHTPTLLLEISGSQLSPGDATVTADLETSGDVAPTGSVTISDDASTPHTCTIAVAFFQPLHYKGSCTLQGVSAGSKVSGSFAGDDDYDAVTSLNSYTVAQTEIALALSGTPVTGDNAYTAALTVPVDGPAPASGVTISDSFGRSCTIASGSLSTTDEVHYAGDCTITAEKASATVTASYQSGDANYYSSASNALTVGKASPTLAISGSPIPGDNVITATLTVPTGGARPTGAVTISDDAGTPNSCSTSTWSGSGTSYSAQCTVAGETPSLTVSASFASDSNYNSAASSNTLTVAKATPTLSLSGSPVVGDNSYTVTLTVPSGGAAPAEGVTVTDSGAASCTVDNGSLSTSDNLVYTGSCQIDGETAGQTVSAAYDDGDTNYNTVSSGDQLTVGQAAPTLAIAGTPVTGDNSYAVTLTVPAGGAAPAVGVTVTDSDTASCVASLSTSDDVHYTGSCELDAETPGVTVSASFAGDTNYDAASSSVLTVAKASPTLDLAGPALTGDNSYTVTLTIPSGGAAPTGAVTISDDAGTPNSCSTSAWSGSGTSYSASCALAGETAGLIVGASFAGDTNYDAASSSTLSVAQATPTLTLAGSPLAGDNTYTVTLTIPAGGAAPTENVTVTDSGTASCAISLSPSDSVTYTGSCELDGETANETVTASYGAGDANYTIATSNTLTVMLATPTTPTISNLPGSGSFGGGFTATVTTNGDGTKSVTSSSPDVCTASGLTVSYVGVGTCSLTAHVAAGTDFGAAAGVAQTFSVAQATPSTPSISNLPGSGIFADGFTATVSTDGDGTVTVTSGSPAVCTVSGLAVSYVGIGTCSLTAHVAAGTNYTGADGVAQTLSVGQATASTPAISNLPGSGDFGGGFTATVSTDGDGATSVTSASPSVCSASGLTVTYVGLGTCSLVAHVAAGTDYSGADGVAQTFSVGQATASTPTISNLPASGTVGGGFTATVSTDGDGTATVTSESPSICSVSGFRVSYDGVGTCSLTAHVAAGVDYLGADGVAQTFSIQAAPPATSLTPTTPTISNLPQSGTFGGDFTATVTTDGDGVRAVTSSSPNVCTVSALTVTYVGVGTCSLVAHVAAGASYDSADGVAQSFPIGQAAPPPPTISDLPAGGAPGGSFTATVTAKGDGVTSVSSNSPSVCTVSGDTVAYVAAGTCSLTAHVAAGTDYSAADGAPQTFAVTSSVVVPAAPTNVTASQGRNNTTVLVTWTAVPATGDVVTYTVSTSDGTTLGETTATSLSVSFGTGQVGKSLVFQVVASNSAGSSAAASSGPLAIVDTSTFGGSAQTAVSSGGIASTQPLKFSNSGSASSSTTLTATVDGGGSLTVQPYTSEPLRGAKFAIQGGSGSVATSYFDIQASPGANGKLPTRVTFKVCGLAPDQDLYYYDAQSKQYVKVADTQVRTNSGDGTTCITVTVRSSSTAPSMQELNGTVFAVVSVLRRETGAIAISRTGVTLSVGKATSAHAVRRTRFATPPAGIATTSDGRGYWIATVGGQVFNVGDAKMYGSLRSRHVTPRAPISAIVASIDSRGYYLLSRRGDVYRFGDARFYGSLTSRGVKADTDVVSMTLTPSGKGYWIVDRLGRVYAFGDAKLHGSFAGPKARSLSYPVVGIASTHDGKGYWLVTTVGQVFGFGDAKKHGQLAVRSPLRSVVGIAVSPSGKGYSLFGANGAVYGFGDAKSFARPKGASLVVVGAAVVDR